MKMKKNISLLPSPFLLESLIVILVKHCSAICFFNSRGLQMNGRGSSAALCRAALCCAALRCAVRCCAVLCWLCCAVLYCTVRYRIVLYLYCISHLLLGKVCIVPRVFTKVLESPVSWQTKIVQTSVHDQSNSSPYLHKKSAR